MRLTSLPNLAKTLPTSSNREVRIRLATVFRTIVVGASSQPQKGKRAPNRWWTSLRSGRWPHVRDSGQIRSASPRGPGSICPSFDPARGSERWPAHGERPFIWGPQRWFSSGFPLEPPKQGLHLLKFFGENKHISSSDRFPLTPTEENIIIIFFVKRKKGTLKYFRVPLFGCKRNTTTLGDALKKTHPHIDLSI